MGIGRLSAVVGIAVLFCCQPALADNCKDTFVSHVSTAHHYIEVANGDVYSYDSGEQGTVDRSFSPMQRVRICPKIVFKRTFYDVQSLKNGLSVSTKLQCNAKGRGC